MRRFDNVFSGLLAGILVFASAGLASAADCTVIFALDDAVTAASLQFSAAYTQPEVELVGSDNAVVCTTLVGGAFGSYVDSDGSASAQLEAALIALSGFTGPTAVVGCALTGQGVPTAADFSITVTDASHADLTPISPLPRVVVESINCVGATTTTTTTTTTVPVSTTTTSLSVATTTTTSIPVGEGYPCDVEFSVVTDATLGSLQWKTSYASASGELAGYGDAVECAASVAGSFASYHDDDAQHELTAAMISLGGFTGPAVVTTCTFLSSGPEPLPGDFVSTLTDVSGPNFETIAPLPTVVVSAVDCGLGTTSTTSTSTSTSTTTTTMPLPICGNGVLELGEDCDDGNGDNSDECLSDCTAAYCGDGFVRASSEECDEGLDNSDSMSDACRTDCTEAVCGDGVVDSGEECDNGTGNSDTVADACRSDCRAPECGDDVVDSGEECDDGEDNNDADPLTCREGCEGDLTCGDADGNGNVTVVDAQVVLQAGIGLLNSCPLLACDASGDGSLRVTDAQRVLAAAIGLPADMFCALLVTVSVEDDTLIGSLQIDIDYSATGDTFLGAAGAVACTGLIGGGSITAFNNDVDAGVLTIGAISTGGLEGPAAIAECRFRAYEQLPDPAAFVVSVAEAADPAGLPIAAPSVSLSY